VIGLKQLIASRSDAVVVALSPSEIAARLIGQVELVRFALPDFSESALWDEALRLRLKELSNAIGNKNWKMQLLLVPPLAELKMVRLPRLSSTERRVVVRRDAAKYFVTSIQPLVVDAIPLATSSSLDVLRQHVVLAANERVLSTIVKSGEDFGFSLVSTSVSNLAFAVGASARAGAARAAIIACAYADRIEIVVTSGGQITAIRHVELDCDSETIAAVIARLTAECAREHERPDLFAVGDNRTPLVPISIVHTTATPTLVEAIRRSDPIAASIAQGSFGPTVELLPAAVIAARDFTTWRQSARNFAAALCLLSATCAYRFYAAKHALQVERARRSELSGQLAQAMRVRDTLTALQREWLFVQHGDVKKWDRIGQLAVLARSIPNDAVLQTVRLRDDTLYITGSADNAEDVLGSLQNIEMLSESRFTSPLEQVVQPDESVTERFSIRSKVMAHKAVLSTSVQLGRSERKP